MSNGFDVAIGMSQSELDAISQSLYTQVYPQLFTGSKQVDYSGATFTVSWDIKAPATFDLSSPDAAQDTLRAHLSGLTGPDGATPSQDQVELAASSAAAFSFTYPTVALKFTAPDVPETDLTLALTANARIDATLQGTQTMDVYSLTAPTQPDPVQNYLLQNVVIPQVLASTQQIFGGVTIPAIQLPGLTLGPPVPFVQSSTLIAVANVAGGGTPPVPDPGSFAWPGSQFFTLLSGNAFQTLTANYIASSNSSMSDSGSNGSHWAGDDWSYSLGIGNPRTAIQGDGTVELYADVVGSVSASVYFLYIPIGVGFTAQAEPGLLASLGLEVNGSSLVVKTRSVAPFELAVTPSGSVPEKITGAMLWPIIQAVVGTFVPFVSNFLGGIQFASFSIPVYSVTVSGLTLTVTPTGLTVGNVGGMLALTGGVSIST
jgi:hypothetical protein